MRWDTANLRFENDQIIKKKNVVKNNIILVLA